MSIEVTGLIKKYGEQRAVDNISFNVQKGEIVGFLGPNGAGKSTTMKIVTGYLRQDEGTATVAGIDVKKDPIGAKRKTGYLPESNPLYYDMYVKEYLSFIAGIHNISNISRKNRIEEVIRITGLSPESNKKTGQLSKGYKQRVGIAASLIHDPEVLVLDEPTTGLDPNQIIEIRELIRKLGQDKTVLFSSHILQEVEAVCDRVVIINKGKIVADDRLGNLQQKDDDTQVVLVNFKENISVELLNNLREINGLERAGDNGWRILTTHSESVRKQLLELSLHHNLNIVSLQSESRSLESIFRNLTDTKNTSAL
ncbi:MAG: gliding motility-associated ABC transporter ATP-binding subunit GldA [Chitinophagaceae bacterium]|nr:gliding motility-associated ABC transporter ATP-binding subunit GldA [Chitinophagaceae bacterium]